MLAELDFRHGSDPNAVPSFLEYLSTGKPARKWNKALMQCARLILRAHLDEYKASGKTRRELVALIDEVIEEVVNAYELGASQRDLLRTELDLFDFPPETSDPGESEIINTNTTTGTNGGNEKISLNAATTLESGGDQKSRRQLLLAEYKSATNNPSNKQIYEASNSGLHKPEFFRWLRGELPADSKVTIRFEKFLRAQKPVLRAKPKI